MNIINEIIAVQFFSQSTVRQVRRLIRQKRSKPKAQLYELVRVCPGGRHAWFDSNIGLVRKQVYA